MKKIFLTAAFGLSLVAGAQKAPDAAERAALVRAVSQKLDSFYVFPDKAKEIGKYLQKRAGEQAYAAAKDYAELVRLIDRDIQSVHTDRHMGLRFAPQRVKEIKQWASAPQPPADMMQRRQEEDRKANFGFVKVEVLPGNIGYLDFRQFYNVSEESLETVAAAMNFIANTDAVIIDLRNNGGGDPSMVQQVTSYFIEKPVLYNSIYNRPTNTTEEFKVLEKVRGRKLLKQDVFVLTSNYTFSGAEELAYNLQSLKRATLVGETTGGGAHPTRQYVINDEVMMSIPIARSINAVTQTNWEGTGVLPEVKVNGSQALLKAQHLYFTKALAKASDPVQKRGLSWRLEEVESSLQPVQLTAQHKNAIVGAYGERSVSMEGNDLWYQRGDRPRRKMIPISPTTYRLEGLSDVRLQFTVAGAGTASKLTVLYDDGTSDTAERTVKGF